MPEIPEFLTLQELCEWLKVPRATVYDWTHRGIIPHLKLGHALRFERQAILKWLEARTRPGRTGGRRVIPLRGHGNTP